ncbi:EamA family transporter [Ewingella allii]|uniref:DMT family transporter n=1 Tax=Ewingella allii TaxID=3092550 RepID=UPI00379F842A
MLNHHTTKILPAKTDKKALTGTLSLLACEALLVVAWSSGFVGARFSIDYTSAFLVVFWRCVLVTVILFPFVIRQLRHTSLATIALNAGIGLLAMAGYLAGVVKGIELGVSAGLAALMADLLPIGTALLALIFMRQKPANVVWLGLLLGVGGVLMVSWSSLSWKAVPLWAYALPLLGMLSLAGATLLQKQFQPSAPLNLTTTLWLQSAASSLAFAILVGVHEPLLPEISRGFTLSVLWTGLFSTFGGYGLYWFCLQRTSAVRVTSVLFLSPPVTLLWAWAMFDEPLSWSMLAGMAVSLLGIGMVIKGDSGKPSKIFCFMRRYRPF